MLIISITRRFSRVFTPSYGSGPKQMYGGDCGIASLICIDRLVSRVQNLDRNSAKFVRDYKLQIVKRLSVLAI